MSSALNRLTQLLVPRSTSSIDVPTLGVRETIACTLLCSSWLPPPRMSSWAFASSPIIETTRHCRSGIDHFCCYVIWEAFPRTYCKQHLRLLLFANIQNQSSIPLDLAYNVSHDNAIIAMAYVLDAKDPLEIGVDVMRVSLPGGQTNSSFIEILTDQVSSAPTC